MQLPVDKMFRLEVNQDKGELSLSWLNDKKEEKHFSTKTCAEKLTFETNQETSRAQIVENGFVATTFPLYQEMRRLFRD